MIDLAKFRIVITAVVRIESLRGIGNVKGAGDME